MHSVDLKTQNTFTSNEYSKKTKQQLDKAYCIQNIFLEKVEQIFKDILINCIEQDYKKKISSLSQQETEQINPLLENQRLHYFVIYQHRINISEETQKNLFKDLRQDFTQNILRVIESNSKGKDQLLVNFGKSEKKLEGIKNYVKKIKIVLLEEENNTSNQKKYFEHLILKKSREWKLYSLEIRVQTFRKFNLKVESSEILTIYQKINKLNVPSPLQILHTFIRLLVKNKNFEQAAEQAREALNLALEQKDLFSFLNSHSLISYVDSAKKRAQKQTRHFYVYHPNKKM